MPLANSLISFEEIHKKSNQSTPSQIAQYKNALELYKLFNAAQPSKNWIDLTNQITVNNRQKFFNCIRVNNFKIGLSTMVNKFFSLNNKIELEILNLSYPAYKKKCKSIFKPYEINVTRLWN